MLLSTCLIQPPAVSFLLGKNVTIGLLGGERDKSNSAERQSLDHHTGRQIILFSKEMKGKMRERENRTCLSTQMGSKQGLKLSPRWIEEEFALAEVATS